MVRLGAQGGEFNINLINKVEIFLLEIDVVKSMMWNFHMDGSQGHHRYGMILGGEILTKLNMELCFSNNTVRVNGGA